MKFSPCALLTRCSFPRLLGVCLLMMTTAGCGYGFRGSGSILPDDVRKVYVPIVENNSTEPGLSTIVTEALRDQFERFGVITIVDDLESADAVLRARVKALKRDTRTVTSSTNTAVQLTTTLTLSGELVRVSGPVLWRSNEITASKGFASDQNVVVTTSSDFASGLIDSGNLAGLSTREVSRSQEREALNALSEEIASKIYDQAVAPDF